MRNKIHNEGRDYTAKDIFDEYQKVSKKYPVRKIDLSLSEKDRSKAKLTYRQFNAIVWTFFKVYITDMFYGKFKTLYSPFIGKMELVRLKADYFGEKRFPNPQDSFGFLWFDRISARNFFLVKFKKTRGTTNRNYKIFKQFQENVDLYLFEPAKSRIKFRFKNQTMFDR